MPLIYDSTYQIFVKKDVQKHSGLPACSAESPAESFYANKFIDISQYNSSYFSFNTPLYYTLGGTLNYYSQDYWYVFTNISRPFIKFTFTANTGSFGTGTTIKHNIYRIPYNDFKDYTAAIIRKDLEEQRDNSTEQITETTKDEKGIVKSLTTTRTVRKTNTLEKLAPKTFPETLGSYDSNDPLYNIKQLLTNPILTITASTTGISTNIYNLFLDEFQKKKGGFQFQLFQDYAQYFITTQFEFERTQGLGLDSFYSVGVGNNLYPINYQQYYKEITPSRSHIITGGTFSGVSVQGNFFTYFLIPNKPKWENPAVTGNLTTFSPTFFWSHTDDGDSFLLQVVYNSGDSASFSGVVYSYPISKEETNLNTNKMLNTPSGDWSITQEVTDVVRKYSVPLSPGKTFWARIGNVKELINIFGVKQQVVAFSDIITAKTSPLPYKNFVQVMADSPHEAAVSKFVYPEYLEDDISTLGDFILSGTVSGSVVTGATMQLIYPNSNYVTQTTNSVGGYIFTSLEAGTYTLNTHYRGYLQDSRVINITGDTVYDVINLSLIWGNNTETWGYLGDYLFTT
jgi:hypothetical protein